MVVFTNYLGLKIVFKKLLHISFVDNNFYSNSVYMEDPKKIMYVPLRKGLKEIREIILTPKNVNGEEIKNFKMLLYIVS